MRSFGTAFRFLVVAVLAGLVALTTVAFGPTAIAQQAGGGLALAKSASPQVGLRSGDTLTYTFVVTNTGDAPVSDIGIEEIAFTGSGTAPEVTCPSGTLQPGRSMTCTATYEVTDADQGTCLIDNKATASGVDPQDNAVTSAPSSARVVTDCRGGGGSLDPGSLDPSDPQAPGSLDPGGLGSSDPGGLGSTGLGSSALGSPALGSLAAAPLAVGSAAFGTLSSLAALYFLALGTPYQPGPP